MREHNDANDNALFNTAIAACIVYNSGPARHAAQAAREAGNAPNTVLAAACALVGPSHVAGTAKAVDVLIDLFAHSGLQSGDQRFRLLSHQGGCRRNWLR